MDHGRHDFDWEDLLGYIESRGVIPIVGKELLRVCEKTVASEGRSRSAGAQEPECILKYMRTPSTAGTRDPERSRFFHKLSP